MIWQKLLSTFSQSKSSNKMAPNKDMVRGKRKDVRGRTEKGEKNEVEKSREGDVSCK